MFHGEVGDRTGFGWKGVIPPDSHLHWEIAVKNPWDFWGSPRFGLGFHWSLDTRCTRSMFCQLPSPGRPMSRARRWENGVGSNLPKDPQLLGALKYLTLFNYVLFSTGIKILNFLRLETSMGRSGSAVDCHDLPWPRGARHWFGLEDARDHWTSRYGSLGKGCLGRWAHHLSCAKLGISPWKHGEKCRENWDFRSCISPWKIGIDLVIDDRQVMLR